MKEIDLGGKVALVTGGSRGLGRQMCLGLADAGADIIVASRNIESCQALVDDIERRGSRGLAVGAHVGKTGDLDRLIESAYDHFGHVDILINNAGINPTIAPLSELTPALYQKMFEVNTMGPWYLASRLAPRMAQHGGGSIINILSVGGLKPAAMQGFYASTKAALHAMTRVMAAEWAPLGIRVNDLAPGSYHSDMFEAASRIPGYLEGAINASLQKRVADTEEILGPVLYLASDMSSYTTGTTLVSDGGYMVL